MRTRLLPLAKIGLTAAACAVLGLAGCDNDAGASTKRAATSLEQGQALLSAGKAEEAAKHFQAADQESAAQPEYRVQAKLGLANTELAQGQAALEALRREQRQVSRLIWELDGIVRQIRTNNELASAFRQRDAAPTLEQIQRRLSETQGADEQSVWLPDGEADIPALAALRQQISRMQGEIAKLEETAASLQSQREQLLAQVEAEASRAESTKGQASVEAFSRASELRKQAADLGTQIEVVRLQLIPLNSDLETARQQQTILENAVAALQEQRKLQEQEWATVQQQIDALSELSANLVESREEGQGSLTNKAAELAAHQVAVAELRQLVDTHLGNAAVNYEEAAKLAEQMINARRQSKSDAQNKGWIEPKIYSASEAIHNPASIRLDKAHAMRSLAAMHARHAGNLAARQRMLESMNQALAQANLMPPQELNDQNLENDLAEARESANRWFSEASDALQTLGSDAPTAGQELKNAAHVARMYTLFAWSQFKRGAGEAEEAERLLQEAQQERDYAKEQGLTLAALPPELSQTAAPAAQTQQPAGGTAPTPAPSARDPTAEIYEEANQPTPKKK